MSTIVTFLDVIRHGEPEGGEVFRGRTDHRLTDNGRRQFQQRLERNPGNWQRVVSSPLSRCSESAELVAGQSDLPLHIDERWAEIDYGAWENVPIKEIMSAEQTHVRQLWEDPMNFCAPGGEPVGKLQSRVLEGWQHILEQHAGQQTLIVTHGGVMRVLAQHLLSLAPEAMNRLGIPYAGMLRLRVDTDHENKHWVTMIGMDGVEL